MASKRELNERIRELCVKAVQAEGEEDWRKTLQELRNALNEHMQKIRHEAADRLLRKETNADRH